MIKMITCDFCKNKRFKKYSNKQLRGLIKGSEYVIVKRGDNESREKKIRWFDKLIGDSAGKYLYEEFKELAEKIKTIRKARICNACRDSKFPLLRKVLG